MNNHPRSDNSLRPTRGRQIKKISMTEAIFIFSIAAAAAFFTAIIQTCFFFNFRPFGFAPDLCLALTVACGIKFGPKFGGVVGLSAGFFIAAFSASGLSLAAIFYTLTGIAMGILASPESASKFSHISLFFIGVLCSAAIVGLGDIIRICVIHAAAPVIAYVFKTVLPEILCTTIFSPAIYFFTALASRKLKKRQGISK